MDNLDPQKWELNRLDEDDAKTISLQTSPVDDDGLFHINEADGLHNGEPTPAAVALYDNVTPTSAKRGIMDRVLRRNPIPNTDITRAPRIDVGGGIPAPACPNVARPGLGTLNLAQLEHQLTIPTTRDKYSYDELKNCICTVEAALKGTNWQRALDEATRLCFTILVIAFIMARHADPSFPSLADWGVIARMRSPFLNNGECLMENQDRVAGEPMWKAKCFEDDQLFLGTGQDTNKLFLKNPDNTWTKLDLVVTPEVRAALESRFDTERQSAVINNQVWRQLT